MSSSAVPTEIHSISTNSSIDTLHNIAKMYLATDDIKESLVNAERLDQKQFNAFFSRNIHFATNTSVQLVMAYDARRVIDLPRILRHELMEIIRGGNKPVISDVLTSGIKCPT